MSRVITLKEWRESQRLTQQKLADDLGVHVQYVSAIERGVRRPGMQVATKIRDYTDGVVTIDSLAALSDTAEAA